MKEIAALLAVLLMIGYMVHMFVSENQFMKRGKLQNKEKAEKGASVIREEPKVAGTKRNRHYIYVVTFSDGTVYQDKCSMTESGSGRHVIRFDTDRAGKILESALEAHRRAVEEKR